MERGSHNSQEMFVRQVLKEVDELPEEAKRGLADLADTLEGDQSTLSPAAKKIIETPHLRMGELPKTDTPTGEKKRPINTNEKPSGLNFKELFADAEHLPREARKDRRSVPMTEELPKITTGEKIQFSFTAKNFEAASAQHVPKAGTPVREGTKCIVAHIEHKNLTKVDFSNYIKYLGSNETFTQVELPYLDDLAPEDRPQVTYTFFIEKDGVLERLGSTNPPVEKVETPMPDSLAA